MLLRIRNCFDITDDHQLSADVEVDKTYIDGNEKNKHKSDIKRIKVVSDRKDN